MTKTTPGSERAKYAENLAKSLSQRSTPVRPPLDGSRSAYATDLEKQIATRNQSRRVPIAVPDGSRPLFERKLAEEKLEKTTARSVEPTGEKRGGTVEVRGGPLVPVQRPHKDWGHAIAHNFEQRALLTTTKFTNLAGTDGSFELKIGDFGYHTVRARAAPEFAIMNITLTKPSGVPEDQIQPSHPSLLTAPRARQRQRWCYLEIYYPQQTTLTFSGDEFAFGVVRQKPEYWDPVELEAIIGAGNPVASAILVRDVVDQTLDAYLLETPRPADTSDLFLVSYNERTGKATITLLPHGMVGMDPEEPEEDTTEPTPTPTPVPDPWNPGTGDGGDNPPIAPELDYTDPDTGLPMVVEPPPPTGASIYALHDRALSISDDGGATWRSRPAPGSANMVDVAAGPGGAFLLDAAGEVWFSRKPAFPFVKLDLTDIRLESFEIPVPNGDFETGELAPWTLVSGDMPRVIRTTSPPQMPGSTYYLSRDWRIINPQDFTIQQRIVLPDDAVGAGGGLRVSVDAYTQNNDTALLELLDGTEVVKALDNFTMTYSGGKFRANGFATSTNEGTLNLVGTPGTANAAWALPDAHPGIALIGSSGAAINGAIAWRIETADGSLFGGQVVLRLFDLDNPNGTRESVDITNVVSYNLLSSDITATTLGTDHYRFTGANLNAAGVDASVGRFHVTVGSSFNMVYRGEWEAALGFKGPGGPAAVGAVLASGEAFRPLWSRIEADYEGPLPPSVIIRLSGIEVDGFADVYFDNVKLEARNVPTTYVATALGKDAGADGGADIYLGGDVLEKRGDAEAVVQAAPSDGITMAESRDGVKVASNGGAAWVYQNGAWGGSIMDSFSSVVADPAVMLLTTDGDLLGANGLAMGATTYAPTSTMSGDRRRSGAIITSPTGETFLVAQDGTPIADAQQPVNASAISRRAIATDVGRCIGWNVGVRDIFWMDGDMKWRLGDATVDGIVKIVEYR